MERKRLAVELKADTEGALKAVFATFGVVDNDGDVTLPGAFETGRKVPIAGVGHNWNIPTIGGGTINADEKAAWLDGLLNLKMVSAREHYESIRFDVDQGINRQEYSYAYDVLKGHSARPDEIKQYGPATKRILEKLLPNAIGPPAPDPPRRGSARRPSVLRCLPPRTPRSAESVRRSAPRARSGSASGQRSAASRSRACACPVSAR